jgi:hypothetical protein
MWAICEGTIVRLIYPGTPVYKAIDAEIYQYLKGDVVWRKILKLARKHGNKKIRENLKVIYLYFKQLHDNSKG